MRAALVHWTILAMAILMISGCRSGGSGKSMWPFGKKTYDSSAESGAMSGPQLPSTGATQEGMTADPYNSYNAPAGNPYDQTNMGAPPANAYPSPGGYPSAAPGNPYAAPSVASAAGVPGYGNDAPPPAGVAPQTGPYSPNYSGQPSADPYAAAPAADPYAAPAADPYATANAGAADPYGAAANAQPYASAGGAPAYPSAQAATAYPAVSPSAAGANPGPVVNNPYAQSAGASTDPVASAAAPQAQAPSADPYAAGSPAAAGGQANYSANALDGGAPRADRYAAGNDAGASGAYQPGNTGYNPGNTGYSPPGVQPYQTAAVDAGAASARRDPYYRPGSTSDYLPSSTSQATAPPGDRYGTPATATAPGWPQGY